MAIIPLPPNQRPPLHQRVQLSRPALALIALVAAVVTYITWQIIQSSSGSNSGLVQVQPPEPANTDEEPEAAPDSVPSGYKQYSNPQKSFAFVYPEVWGDMQDSEDDEAELSVSTPAITNDGLSEVLQAQVFGKNFIRVPVGSQGVQIAPSLTPTGEFEWKVVDKGKATNTSVGRLYEPQPQVVYESGKASVYSFTRSENGCTYNIWVFPVGESFVKMRLPSFCAASGTSNAEIQAKRKADFDAAKDVILKSITVL